MRSKVSIPRAHIPSYLDESTILRGMETPNALLLLAMDVKWSVRFLSKDCAFPKLESNEGIVSLCHTFDTFRTMCQLPLETFELLESVRGFNTRTTVFLIQDSSLCWVCQNAGNNGDLNLLALEPPTNFNQAVSILTC